MWLYPFVADNRERFPKWLARVMFGTAVRQTAERRCSSVAMAVATWPTGNHFATVLKGETTMHILLTGASSTPAAPLSRCWPQDTA